MLLTAQPLHAFRLHLHVPAVFLHHAHRYPLRRQLIVRLQRQLTQAFMPEDFVRAEVRRFTSPEDDGAKGT